ncbi:hypothetical protein LOTGIDRAFT_163522 [Lottia gigantea]|uniref:VWFC domain-containing protein n=1 Tax=Lottia gigantea TaxID=225164 RepID=V4ACH2_LOTGI|nr:hypothetical protein LOTGIDRAFT_163522 [Lottia gigantea]ESO91006.1 hypothetical protein LOTGIDRAFT_163522 [Lottia gigantea]
MVALMLVDILFNCIDSTCKDELINCVDYGKDACTKYAQWAADKCAKYCDLCPGKTTSMLAPTTTAPKVTGCVDKLPNCGLYDPNICTDHKYAQWSRVNCPEHCNMCTPGCYFNGNVYKQSEVFKDACKLKCTCKNAALGQFACTSMCYSWNLPDICTMEPPKPGKCCSTPKCPDNVHIKYPDGYTED